MDAILTMLMVIDWFCNDVHYQSKGDTFYALHLLADRVRDFGSAEDDFKETYYLGQKGQFPPSDATIAQYAIAEYQKIAERSEGCLMRLLDALDVLVHQVEVCKKDAGLAAGVHAILDNISQKALTYKFLVSNQTGGDE